MHSQQPMLIVQSFIYVPWFNLRKESHVIAWNAESRVSRYSLWYFSNNVVQGKVSLSSSFSWEVFRRRGSDFFALFKLFNFGFIFKSNILILKSCIFIFQRTFLNDRVSFITHNMYRFFHTQSSPIKHSICFDLQWITKKNSLIDFFIKFARDYFPLFKTKHLHPKTLKWDIFGFLPL